MFLSDLARSILLGDDVRVGQRKEVLRIKIMVPINPGHLRSPSQGMVSHGGMVSNGLSVLA